MEPGDRFLFTYLRCSLKAAFIKYRSLEINTRNLNMNYEKPLPIQPQKKIKITRREADERT